MIITEQLYTILDASMTGSIDWSQTYQTPDTARFSYDRTQFVISKPEDSDYLSNENWITQEQIYTIVSTEAFSGPREPITGSI